MKHTAFDVDKETRNKSYKEQFKEERLSRDNLTKEQWPSQIDRAALDIHYDIAIGQSDDLNDIGGTIDRINFPEATGEYYIDGLNSLAGEDSNVAEALRNFDERQIGSLVFQLNTFRHKLDEVGQELDIDRALEAFLEKNTASAIDQSSRRDRNAGAGIRRLRDTDSVSDLVMRLFSSADVSSFAGELMQVLPKSSAKSKELLHQIDAPYMTTPLWKHQRAALKEWIELEQMGYVDMATATGKTVLGLAAIAYRYGELHPVEYEHGIEGGTHTKSENPNVLIVAGSEVLLNQWRDEFDKHLDIPKSRTEPIEGRNGPKIELDWGDVEFRTAQDLSDEQDFSRYDLTILDEAHRYTQGSTSGGRWGDLFQDLTTQSSAVLAMSGSVDGGWEGDKSARDALENHLDRCLKFSVAKARDQGVIADFSWEIQYARATDMDQEKLADQTNITTAHYDAESGILSSDKLGVSDQKLPEDFVSYQGIRSFVQSNTGNNLRENSPDFDTFASAILARRPIQWNAAPTLDTILTLIDRHAPEQKTVVLVQAYDKATTVRDALLEDGYAREQVIALEGGSDKRYEKIQQFNELDGGVIIGPGNLLGMGVDMPDAEIAINISRGRVNASLVQRIGRVLRNPEESKEAHFYHLVPVPTKQEAIDFVEDGARLIRQAAEFRALGETFKEAPSFTTHNDEIADQVVTLEQRGVKLLERIEDETELVKGVGADEYIRRLQSVIYDVSKDGVPESPAVTTWGAAETESSEYEDGQFPTRNESYEQYRLALGPYRAAKAVAQNYLGSDIQVIETDDGYEVKLDEAFANTEFNNAITHWTTQYKKWREECDNRDGDGEPGSLPAYKEEWPEPRGSDGKLLTAEAAQKIGIDYKDQDPIFFPVKGDGIYELPLPENQALTIDGIVDDLDDEQKQVKSNSSFHVSVLALSTIRQETNGDTSLEHYAKEAVSELLENYLQDEPVPRRTFDSLPQESIALELPKKQLDVAELVVQNPDEPHQTVDEVIESALVVAGGVSSKSVDEIAISLDEDLNSAITYLVDHGEVNNPEQFVTSAVRKHIKEIM